MPRVRAAVDVQCLANYVVWRNGLGTTFFLPDYDFWRAQFGEPTQSISNFSNERVYCASTPRGIHLLL
jgi:hypothetical protein